VTNANLITKVYFPRLVIPISAVAAGLVDFVISFGVLLGLMLYYKIRLTWMIFTIPLFVLLAVLTALAVSLWLSALNVQYRDVQYMIPFLIQAWMYASPVAYSASLVPTGIWRIIYGLNPMAGVIQGFRWALLGGNPPDELMTVSVIMVLLLLVSGLYYFRGMERTFADVV
jgi:lipopolysaccharide transport system permease protein